MSVYERKLQDSQSFVQQQQRALDDENPIIQAKYAAPLKPEFDEKGFDQALQFFPGAEKTVYDADHSVAERAQEMRDQVNLHYSGIDKSMKFGLKDGVPANGAGSDKHARRSGMNMADMVVEQAYQQAYNNAVSFSIGGQNIEFSQGEMYDEANNLAESAQERLERLKREGASEEEIKKAQKDLEDYRRIAELTDPKNGPMTPEKQAEIQSIFDNNERVAKDFASADQRYDAAKEYADKLEALDSQKASGELTEQEFQAARQSVVDSVPAEIKEDFQSELDRRANNAVSGTHVKAASRDSYRSTSAAKEVDPVDGHEERSVSGEFNTVAPENTNSPAAPAVDNTGPDNDGSAPVRQFDTSGLSF